MAINLILLNPIQASQLHTRAILHNVLQWAAIKCHPLAHHPRAIQIMATDNPNKIIIEMGLERTGEILKEQKNIVKLQFQDFLEVFKENCRFLLFLLDNT
jgi:hypothetical protein